MITLTEGGLLDMTNNNVGIDSKILYPGVYTCITLTCVLSTNSLVGITSDGTCRTLSFSKICST